MTCVVNKRHTTCQVFVASGVMKRMPASRTPRAFQYQAVSAGISPQAISSDLTRSTAWCLCFCAKSHDRPREAEKGTAQPSITDVGIKPSRHVDLSSSRPSDRDACQSGIPYQKESPQREQSTKGTQPLKPVGDGRPDVVSRRTMTKKIEVIPHPNSYPMPRGRPGLHDIYAGDETKERNRRADPPLLDARKTTKTKNKRWRWLRKSKKANNSQNACDQTRLFSI